MKFTLSVLALTGVAIAVPTPGHYGCPADQQHCKQWTTNDTPCSTRCVKTCKTIECFVACEQKECKLIWDHPVHGGGKRDELGAGDAVDAPVLEARAGGGEREGEKNKGESDKTKLEGEKSKIDSKVESTIKGDKNKGESDKTETKVDTKVDTKIDSKIDSHIDSWYYNETSSECCKKCHWECEKHECKKVDKCECGVDRLECKDRHRNDWFKCVECCKAKGKTDCKDHCKDCFIGQVTLVKKGECSGKKCEGEKNSTKEYEHEDSEKYVKEIKTVEKETTKTCKVIKDKAKYNTCKASCKVCPRKDKCFFGEKKDHRECEDKCHKKHCRDD